MSNRQTNIHISAWEDFKRTVAEVKPKAILYMLQRAPLAKPPVGIRLIFTDSKSEFIFLDVAEENLLKKTGIPVRFTTGGEAYLEDEDIKRFLISQLKRTDIQIISMNVMGY